MFRLFVFGSFVVVTFLLVTIITMRANALDQYEHAAQYLNQGSKADLSDVSTTETSHTDGKVWYRIPEIHLEFQIEKSIADILRYSIGGEKEIAFLLETSDPKKMLLFRG